MTTFIHPSIPSKIPAIDIQSHAMKSCINGSVVMCGYELVK